MGRWSGTSVVVMSLKRRPSSALIWVHRECAWSLNRTGALRLFRRKIEIGAERRPALSISRSGSATVLGLALVFLNRHLVLFKRRDQVVFEGLAIDSGVAVSDCCQGSFTTAHVPARPRQTCLFVGCAQGRPSHQVSAVLFKRSTQTGR
jgi:hypothetical protein